VGGLGVSGATRLTLGRGVTDGAVFVGDTLRLANCTGGGGAGGNEFTVTALGGAAGEGVEVCVSVRVCVGMHPCRMLLYRSARAPLA
jgi:hypothetical protein